MLRMPLISLSLFAIGVNALLLGGCAHKEMADEYDESMLAELPFVYKMNVQQGNVVTEEMTAQLSLGLTRAQVRYLLGSPLLTDMFHSNRWDYIYSIKRGHQPTEIQRLTLYFEGDELVEVDGISDLSPAEEKIMQEAPRSVVVEVPDWQDDRGVITKALNRIGLDKD